MSRLEEIEEKLNAATPEPWAVPVANLFRVIAPNEPHNNRPQGSTPPYPWRVVADMAEPDGTAADARLIAAAPSDLRYLLEIAVAAKAVLDQATPPGVLGDSPEIAALRAAFDA